MEWSGYLFFFAVNINEENNAKNDIIFEKECNRSCFFKIILKKSSCKDENSMIISLR